MAQDIATLKNEKKWREKEGRRKRKEKKENWLNNYRNMHISHTYHIH